MFQIRKLSAAIPLMALLSLSGPVMAEDHPEGIHIHDAYARVMGGKGASGAVFFMIHNNTGVDITITGAESAVAELVQLHTHKMDDQGMMQMMQIEGGVPVAMGEVHAFERGGDHVMLMGLTEELAEGDIVHVKLILDGADPVEFDATVNKGNGDMGDMGQSDGASPAGHDHSAHGHGTAAAVDTTGMADPEAIAAIMKAQFETPESALTVKPVVVEGDHALASWAQDGKGGRALLERRQGQWVIVLCGGADLRLPAFLGKQGVPGAETLSAAFNAAEDGLGGDKVGLFSSFEGIVMISEPME